MLVLKVMKACGGVLSMESDGCDMRRICKQQSNNKTMLCS